MQRANSKIVSNRIKQALKKLNMSNPILVNAFNPFFNSVKSRAFNQKASIYYCYDNIAAATWASKHGTRLEKELINQIDAVVFSSDALQNSKKTEGISSFVVNNGVDLSLFETEMQNISFNSDRNEINIGYVGTIDDRLDFDLLEKMVKYFDSWNFHLIGRITTSKSETLKQYSNVKFYGAVDVKLLPSILKNMNAGIIPFVKNEFTQNIYPMKANEYLALGMPVVMTDFAKLNDLNNIVTVSKKDSFILKLLSEIENDTLEKQQQRIQKAKANSWKNKAIEFENILLNYA